MITRDILDINNNVIGQATFPDDTSESQIESVLSSYKEKPAIHDVTPRQIQQALILSGVSLSSIEAALASLPEPTKSLAQVEWNKSVAFERHRPLVAQVGAMLGWTSDQLDALWQFAATL
jgi:hypothetical protein